MLPGMGAQLQVTNSARLGDDDIIRELVLNWFLQIGYQFCCRNGFNNHCVDLPVGRTGVFEANGFRHYAIYQ